MTYHIQAIDQVRRSVECLIECIRVCNHQEWMLEELLDSYSCIHIEVETVLQEVAAGIAYIWRKLRWTVCILNDLHNSLGIISELNPRRLTSKHFDYTATKAPNVRRFTNTLTFDDFGRHPERRPSYLLVLL